MANNATPRPESLQLWNRQLEELERREKHLLELIEEPKADTTLLQLAIANSSQQKGVALRHLKRYSEALQELNKSQEVLNLLEQNQNCTKLSNDAICKDIQGLFSTTFTLTSNVYQDLEDNANAEKYLKLAVQSSSQSENHPKYLGYLVNWYAENRDFYQAIEIIFSELKKSLVAHKNQEIVAHGETIEEVYLKLFRSISWDLNTGELREKDPRDFFDTHDPGIGRDFKYGMVNWKEDLATFGSLIVEDEVEGSNRVEQYIRQQMSEGNFEPIAKYLYVKYILLRFSRVATDKGYIECPEASTSITFDEVQEQLEQALLLSEVSDWTIHVIELLERGSQFLNTHCKN